MKALTLRFCLTILFGALLTACSTPKKQSPSDANEFASTALSPDEKLLSEAHSEKDRQRKSELFLNSAKLFSEKGLDAQTTYALGLVEVEALSTQSLTEFRLLLIETSLKTGDIETVKEQLKLVSLGDALQTTLSRQERIVRLIANAYSKVEQPLDAAVLLADYEGVFGVNESAQLTEEIWLLFQRSKTDDLVSYTYFGDNPNTIAWLELARQVKLNQSSIDEQYNVLNNWLTQNPNHPASQALPMELELLSRLPDTAPDKIILALPLSGSLKNIGAAIMDGFLAAHFQYKNHESKLKIETFDTATRDVSQLYLNNEQNLSEKTLVIGPITKEEIERLSEVSPLPINSLALNNPPDTPYQNRLFLFGLDPEQEMTQISDRMAIQGMQRVAVIAPDTKRATRLSKSFEADFISRGGHVVSKAYFGDDRSLAQTVAKMLSTADSKERSRRLTQVTGLALETRPERRNDLDAILMLGSHEDGKQIKPLLAFNFAQNLPVFASSSVHIPDRLDANNDLSKVQFPDIPWVFTQSNPLRAQIETARPALSDRYARFYALGADAYLLAPRLTLLREIPNSFAQGLTGKLNINPDGVIERELQWAKYRRGKAVTIN